jgi:hypothetical protein
MSVQFFYPEGRRVNFQQLDRKRYKGVLLPGSEIQQSHTSSAVITVQELSYPPFTIGYRLFEIFSKIKFSINESTGLRLEAILSGEMQVSVNGEKQKFKAGEYRITDVPLFRALFKKNTSCNIFITYYSDDLLKQLGIALTPHHPLRMPDAMTNLINEMLRNPFAEKLRDFYYENCVRNYCFFILQKKIILYRTSY